MLRGEVVLLWTREVAAIKRAGVGEDTWTPGIDGS
jgi:hypothetical protein